MTEVRHVSYLDSNSFKLIGFLQDYFLLTANDFESMVWNTQKKVL